MSDSPLNGNESDLNGNEPEQNEDDSDKTLRYGQTYRRDELQLICDFALSGESLCFVGIAGTGKSNITRFLLEDPYGYKPDYLGDHTETVHFPCVDATVWNGESVKLWSAMLESLEEITAGFPEPVRANSKVLPMSSTKEERELLIDLGAHIRWICHDLGHQLMFVLDDIDNAVATGPPEMLNRFFNLRSSNNKGKLSFLFFVKGLPHMLRREQNLDDQFKFIENINPYIYVLPLYNEVDARQMLEHLNDRGPKRIPQRELRPIERLCGGHAGLLRIVYNIWVNARPVSVNVSDFYRSNPAVGLECERILKYLHRGEQEVAVRVARNEHTVEDEDVIDLLQRRGLLTSRNPPTWFSELMAIYLRG